MGTITGVQAGGKGSFQAVPQPDGAVIRTGQTPQWSADIATVHLTPSVDGLTCDAAVDVGATGSFILTVLVGRTDGTNAIGQATVSILPATPPPPPELTSFDINQTA